MQMIPLQLLVFTPKGNIPHVAQYLMKNGLLLEHPSPPYDPARHPGTYYHNPHNPPPGGFARAIHSSRSHLQARWSQPQTTISAKTLDGTRSQVDEVFNSLRSGDDLEEIEPGKLIETGSYLTVGSLAQVQISQRRSTRIRKKRSASYLNEKENARVLMANLLRSGSLGTGNSVRRHGTTLSLREK